MWLLSFVIRELTKRNAASNAASSRFLRDLIAALKDYAYFFSHGSEHSRLAVTADNLETEGYVTTKR